MRFLTTVTFLIGLLSLGACCYPCHVHCAIESADALRIHAESSVETAPPAAELPD
jgi:hypothetical protein